MARNSLKNVIRLIDISNESRPVEQCFLTDLKRSIEIEDEKGSRIPSKTYKPSSMQCIRNMYYQRIGKIPDESCSSYVLVGICNSGTDIHERIQKAVVNMKNTGMDCEYVDVGQFVKERNLDYLEIVSKNGMETKLFHKNLIMSFLCDGIIRYKGRYYILELKTETSNKFWSRKDVDPKHYDQATAYSIAFGIDEVLFVYISRDTLDMKSFLFTATSERKQELVGRIENCEDYIRRLQVPPKPAEMIKSVCQYCNYKQSCKKEIV